MEVFEWFRFVTIATTVVMLLLVVKNFTAWRKWARSKKMLGYAVTMLMVSNGYAAFEATMDGSPGAGRSLLIAACMVVGLFAVVTSLRDDRKEREILDGLVAEERD